MMILKVGTTFSGIGAPEQALKNLGIKHEVKWACDNNKYAKEAYYLNHTCSKWYDNIITIVPEDLEDVDLYIFGFPCQDVSVFGNQDLSKGKTALVEYSLNIIDKKLPKYILFENVRGLLQEKFKDFYESIIKRLEVNYNMDIAVLNSKHWGVPQNRERVYGLGTLKGHKQAMLPIEDKTNTTNLQSILEKSVDDKYTLTDHKWNMLQNHRQKQFEKAGPSCFGYRFVTDKAYCLTTSYGSVPFQLIEQPNKNPRMYTERECARLHGFPDTFLLHDTHAYKQLGNTITVPVLQAIFKNVFNVV